MLRLRARHPCLKYLRGEGFGSWSEVRPSDLRAFLADEAMRRPAASSQARTVAALKGFFRFCVESEWLDRDPALVLRTPKKREALPDVLDRHELKRLMRAPDLAVWERAHHGKRERDRLLLAVFAYAGLRRSELLGLDWDDVDLHRGLLRVRHAKAATSASFPSTPRLARCSSITSTSASRWLSRRCSWASRAGGSLRPN